MQALRFVYGLPQTTVHEALLFSARCRLSNEHSNKTVAAFSQEVILTVHNPAISPAVRGYLCILTMPALCFRRLADS